MYYLSDLQENTCHTMGQITDKRKFKTLKRTLERFSSHEKYLTEEEIYRTENMLSTVVARSELSRQIVKRDLRRTNQSEQQQQKSQKQQQRQHHQQQQLNISTPESHLDMRVPGSFDNTSFSLTKRNDVNLATLRHLVTFVFNFRSFVYPDSKYIRFVLNGLDSAFPGVPVYVILPKNVEVITTLNFVSVNGTGRSKKPGKSWNDLISRVKTPFVFLGRELVDFNTDVHLDKLLWDFITRNLTIVGGAIKILPSGQWLHNCYQMVYKSYTLAYQVGYKESASDCLKCNFLHGPFLARTDFMKSTPFDEGLTKHVLFYDYFVKSPCEKS